MRQWQNNQKLAVADKETDLRIVAGILAKQCAVVVCFDGDEDWCSKHVHILDKNKHRMSEAFNKSIVLNY